MATIGLVAFAVGLVIEGAVLVGVVASALGLASYWPAGERGWHYYVHWAASHLVTLSIPVTYVALGDVGLAPLEYSLPGAVLAVAGFAVAFAAGLDLGVEETAGLEGELRTDGWYRYSRNPQYVGYLAASIGCALLANAWPVTVLLAGYCTWWLSLPVAEEPWLREQYGEAYERYAERVPRFVGPGTIRAVLDRGDPTP